MGYLCRGARRLVAADCLSVAIVVAIFVALSAMVALRFARTMALAPGANQRLQAITLAGTSTFSLGTKALTFDVLGITTTSSSIRNRNATFSNGIVTFVGTTTKITEAQRNAVFMISSATLRPDDSAAALSSRLSSAATIGTLSVLSGQGTISFTGASGSVATTLTAAFFRPHLVAKLFAEPCVLANEKVEVDSVVSI
jgi:hypothetical protein